MALRTHAAPDYLRAAIYQVDLPLDPRTGFEIYHQYRGAMRNAASFSCHMSALAYGESPHPPHMHPEEEILIMLRGEADIVLPGASDGPRERRLTAGQFVYYPAGFSHTLKAVSEQPANYLMFKWRSARRARKDRLGFQQVDIAAAQPTGEPRGFIARPVFEGSTGHLGKLHAHLSLLAPDAGYEPHVDDHDGAIVVLSGEVETLGRRVRPHGVIHFAAGEPHGLRNPGPDPARYLVFEFHAPVPLVRKLADPQRWKGKLRGLARRLGRRP